MIIDESTNTSVTKFLAISITSHSVTKSTIVTTFLNLCTLEVCMAVESVAAMKSILKEYCQTEKERHRDRQRERYDRDQQWHSLKV